MYGSEFGLNFLQKKCLTAQAWKSFTCKALTFLSKRDNDDIYDAANDDSAEVNLADISLQKLSLDRRAISPYERNWKQELVYITTHEKCTYILIQTISKLTILTTERAV